MVERWFEEDIQVSYSVTEIVRREDQALGSPGGAQAAWLERPSWVISILGQVIFSGTRSHDGTARRVPLACC